MSAPHEKDWRCKLGSIGHIGIQNTGDVLKNNGFVYWCWRVGACRHGEAHKILKKKMAAYRLGIAGSETILS